MAAAAAELAGQRAERARLQHASEVYQKLVATKDAMIATLEEAGLVGSFLVVAWAPASQAQLGGCLAGLGSSSAPHGGGGRMLAR